MYYAIGENSASRVQAVLITNPEIVNCELINGATNPICNAAFLGYNHIILLLIKYNADVNLRSSDGRTPLMWAAMRGHMTTMEMLLENGADRELTD